MGRVKDLTGNRYGRLLVLCRTARRVWRGFNVTWYCLCDCGVVTTPVSGNLVRGSTRSCGCLKKELASKRNTTHGQSGNRIYKVWHHIMDRCYNEEYHQYNDYGGRGIEVCREWKKNMLTFVDWALANGYSGELQIDRRDNNGDYKPSNCHFVTNYVNSHNKRRVRRDNKSGYAGVFLNKTGVYIAYIGSRVMNNNKRINLGTFPDPVSAVLARNEFIVANNLPHRIQEVPNAHSG